MRARARAVSDEIPTSSMADIAFLLIVYFLITMAFTVTRGLDFALPHDRAEPRVIQRVESVLIEVQPTGKLLVDSRSLPIEELLDYLRPRLLQDPEKPVIVKTDPVAPYGAMVAVLDELRQGRERLGLEKDIVISIPTERERAQLWG